MSKLSLGYSWRQGQTRLVVYTTNPMECIVIAFQRQHAHEPYLCKVNYIKATSHNVLQQPNRLANGMIL